MPHYEYRCPNHHVFEVFHEVGGTPGPCPVCGQPARRVFTSVGLVFKGSGFHSTDYRRPAATDGAAARESSPEESPTKGSPAGSGKSTEAAAKSD